MSKEKRKVNWRSKFTKDQILTIPNMLSFFRMALIPVIVWVYCGLEMPLLALAFILLSGLTDIIDGYIARKYHLVTNFGKFMDPLADKLLVCAAMIALVEIGRIPSWIVIFVNPVQSRKTSVPMLLTVVGSVTVFRLLHFSNTSSPIVTSPSANSTLCNALHS